MFSGTDGGDVCGLSPDMKGRLASPVPFPAGGHPDARRWDGEGEGKAAPASSRRSRLRTAAQKNSSVRGPSSLSRVRFCSDYRFSEPPPPPLPLQSPPPTGGLRVCRRRYGGGRARAQWAPASVRAPPRQPALLTAPPCWPPARSLPSSATPRLKATYPRGWWHARRFP